jgi:hypothetical protein
MPRPSASPERAALSRELGEFLVELSIGLNRYAMYPEGHPSLGPGAAGIVRRAETLLQQRSVLALGVARDQLVIEGVATDVKHPVLRELAARLHRHQLGAVTFRRGVDVAEVASALRALSADAERGGVPLGLGPPEALRAWPHIELHPVTFGQLELVDQEAAPDDARGAQLWIGLARAALAGGEESTATPATTEPVAIARAIDEHPRSAAYDQVVVGYLLQISSELQAAGGADAAALRRRISRLIAAMHPDTLRRLVEMGGDARQRHQFVLDASHGMSVDAVLEIVKAAAEASGQTISHGLLRMLSKMATHAGDEGATWQQADAQLREQVRSLVDHWTLADPNPEGYGRVLETMARTAPLRPGRGLALDAPEAIRMVQLGLELDRRSLALWRAVSAVVDQGRVVQVVELLDQLPAYHETGRDVWRHLGSPGVVRRLLTEPADFKTLDRLLPRLDVPALEPMLDTLAESSNRATRRALLDRLARAPADLGPSLVGRLRDQRWYVQRNMLVLLDSLSKLPEGFAPAPYAAHPDARVRREALKLRLKVPADREAGILAGLEDPDAQVAQLALIAAQQGCSSAALAVITRRLTDGTYAEEIRVPGIKALGRSHSPEALDVLLAFTDGGTNWFGRRRLPPKSPELLAALVSLAGGWSRHPRARQVLARAGRAPDPEIRAAAGAAGLP